MGELYDEFFQASETAYIFIGSNNNSWTLSGSVFGKQR
jgi:hypothetical protein